MADSVEGLDQKPPKKRSRNPDEWKREKRKRLRVAGSEYVNSKGLLVKAREIGHDCTCRRRCYDRVDEDTRDQLFNGYYSLNSHDEQNAYLYGLIRKVDIARKRNKDSDRRTCTYKYFVRIHGKEVQVCRAAFANIHGISPNKIGNLCNKLSQNIMFPRDGRGRHDNRPKKIKQEQVDAVKEHIFSIIRSDRIRDFFKDEKGGNVDLNITKMWKDYLEKYDPNYPNYTARHSKKNRLPPPRDTLQQQQMMMQQMMHPTQLGLGLQQQSLLPGQIILPHFMNDDGGLAQMQGATISLPPNVDMQQIVLNATPQELQPQDCIMPEDPDEEIYKKPRNRREPKVEPIIKHWLYSKVYHEEFRFQDFLTLKKKIFDMRDNSGSQAVANAAASVAAAIKTERKQKTPKKIQKYPSLPAGRTYIMPSNVIAAAASAAGVPSGSEVMSPAAGQQQQTVAAVAAALGHVGMEQQHEQFIIPHLLNLNQMIPQQNSTSVLMQPNQTSAGGHQILSIAPTGQNSVMNLSMSSLAGTVNLVPQTSCNYIPPSSWC